MDYAEALNFIHSVSWKGSRPGLGRTERLLSMLGDPQNKLRFVHVAGTNGKGSFCSMLDSVLRESGARVGLYTSPFVERFNERMRVDGRNISDAELAEITEYIKPFAESMEDSPTEFELITAIAFEYFSRQHCDIVVLECGMGGRLDSTNVISTPILSVITGIALDHTAFLGDTVEKIAYEKAGIIKGSVPCLWCGSDKAAEAVIRKRADELGSELFTVDKNNLKIKKTDLCGTVFDFGEYKDLKISLLGTYQPSNASNVVRAVEILRENGFEISDDDIYNGLLSAKWAARFELLCDSPAVISDGGHNPEGVCAAVESVKKYFPNEKLLLVTGVMADKDYLYMAKKMSEVSERAFCVTPDNPRAMDADELASVFESVGVHARAFDSIDSAIFAAISLAKEQGRAVLCLGSLYMYADVKHAVQKYTAK